MVTDSRHSSVRKVPLSTYGPVYSDGGPVTASNIVKILKRHPSERTAIQDMLLRMVDDGLISYDRHGFKPIVSIKHQLLNDLIHYCLDNKLNHRRLLTASMAKFVSLALQKKKFRLKDFDLSSITFSKYVNVLFRSGLLILFSEKPIEAMIPFNSFIGKLLSYFDLDMYTVKESSRDYFKDIQRERKLFFKLKERDFLDFKKVIESYKFSFVKHSLSLEGNPITLSDTISLLRDQIVPRSLRLKDIKEVENYQKAVSLMFEDFFEGRVLTKERILRYHLLAMRHEIDFVGKIRNVPVYIKGNPNFKILDFYEIDEKFDDLLLEYNQFIFKKKRSVREIFEFVAYFHNQFQYIHPFVDGNSRVTRLLIFHLFLYLDIPILDIPLGLHDEYMEATKKYKKRDDEMLSLVLQKIVLYNLKSVNRQMR